MERWRFGVIPFRATDTWDRIWDCLHGGDGGGGSGVGGISGGSCFGGMVVVFVEGVAVINIMVADVLL